MPDFNEQDRQLLAETDEVRIETRKGGKRLRIWIVVVGDGVYVRSVRGVEGRWYQALLGGTEGWLHLGKTVWNVKGEQVSDAAEIQAVSDALRTKYYEKWPQPTEAMLRPAVLPTTLRLLNVAS
jgi:hypothetical protein